MGQQEQSGGASCYPCAQCWSRRRQLRCPQHSPARPCRSPGRARPTRTEQHGQRAGQKEGRKEGRTEGRALTLGVLVAQRCRAHVAQADGALAAAVHEGVALVRVELGRRDHLRQLLHVGRLDVHDVCHSWSRPATLHTRATPAALRGQSLKTPGRKLGQELPFHRVQGTQSGGEPGEVWI